MNQVEHLTNEPFESTSIPQHLMMAAAHTVVALLKLAVVTEWDPDEDEAML